jgi:hypothetical protein
VVVKITQSCQYVVVGRYCVWVTHSGCWVRYT